MIQFLENWERITISDAKPQTKKGTIRCPNENKENSLKQPFNLFVTKLRS